MDVVLKMCVLFCIPARRYDLETLTGKFVKSALAPRCVSRAMACIVDATPKKAQEESIASSSAYSFELSF